MHRIPPGGGTLSPNRVLVPTIGTPGCRKAEARGIELAKGGGAVLFLYVVDTAFFQEIPRSSRHEGEATHDLDVIGRLILDRAVADARPAGVSAEGRLAHGRVDEEILSACHAFHATHVVVSKEKRGFLARQLPKDRLAAIERESGARFEVVEA